MIISVLVEKVDEVGARPVVQILSTSSADEGDRWAQREANENEFDGFLFQVDTVLEDLGVGEEARLVRLVKQA